MDLKNFDKQIKSNLENFEAPYDSSSWQALENRMNAVFAEEEPAPVEQVDLIVKRALERLEAPYQTADWSLMNTRLNQNLLVRRIKMSKIAELAIFLLLLANIEGFLGGFKEVLKPVVPQPVHKLVPMAKASHHKSGKHLAKASAPGTSIAAVSTLAGQVVDLIRAPFDALEGTIVQSADISATLISQNNASLLDGSHFYSTSGIVKFNKIAPIPQSKVIDMAWKNYFEVIPGVTVPVEKKSNGLYAASFASFDKNDINTSDKSTHQNNYGGGIAVGYRKGKWGVETGLTYSRKSFSPEKDVAFYAGNPIVGFLGAYVKDVDADVFSIPVKVTRRLAKVGGATAHAVAGLTANVATEKRVNYKTVFDPGSNPGGSNTLDPAIRSIPAVNNKGVLEGGALKTNSYVTADIGVRVEQSLGRRYTAFVEPSYHRALGGGPYYGPKTERTHAFTIQAGVMAAL
jgi:hypothetical protein